MAGIGIGIGIGVGMTRGGGVSGIPFLLTSTGDGSGVSTLTMTASEDTILTLDGTARFYSDAGGTLDESTTWTVTVGAARTRYIKCPSDTANFHIATDTITSWETWTHGTNKPVLGGDLGQLTSLTYLYVFASQDTLSGDISALTGLTYIRTAGTCALSGSVAAMTSLTYLYDLSSGGVLSGSVAALTSLTYLNVLGGTPTLSGSVAGLTSLTYLRISGENTMTGDLSVISDGLTHCDIRGYNQIVTYTSGGDWSSIAAGGTVRVNPAAGYGLSEAEVDLFIIEVEDTRTASRAINLTLTGSNAARTGASDAAVAAIIADGGTVTTNP